MSDVARRRTRAFNWASIGFLLLSLVVLAIGVATSRAVVLIGVGMVVATALFVAIGLPFVSPFGQVEGDWVQLSFVDRRFARVLDDRYGNT
jgi:sulfite exporter TauE/SafE